MGSLKITTWNVEHLDGLLRPSSSATTQRHRAARREAVREQIEMMDSDILCIVEGPMPERIDTLTHDVLNERYVAVKAPDDDYGTRGTQYVWFLVKPELAPRCSLLPTQVWDAFCGSTWPVHFWGSHETEQHDHYRHPQVLVLDWFGERIEFIGLHLKSKIVSLMQESDWNAGGVLRKEFVEGAIKARIKLATEAANVRAYIDAKFKQTPDPAIFVLGDLNDGPGKEYFENLYLFFDLVSNIQGDVFFAKRFLNHALFDFKEELRWSVQFEDFITPERPPEILLDHILFTQSLVDGLHDLRVNANAGFIEHEATELINAQNYKYAHTSDHRPVSVIVTTSH